MLPAPAKPRVKVKTFIKIGRPGYKVTKQKDTKTDQHSLLFQVRACELELFVKISFEMKGLKIKNCKSTSQILTICSLNFFPFRPSQTLKSKLSPIPD